MTAQQKLRVLVIDDSYLLYSLLSFAFEDLVTIDWTEHVSVGRHLASKAARRVPYDLMILDHELASSFRIVDHIRAFACYAGTPILLFSSSRPAPHQRGHVFWKHDGMAAIIGYVGDALSSLGCKVDPDLTTHSYPQLSQ